MIIPLNIKLKDEYCSKCRALAISSVRISFSYTKEVQELINFFEQNPLVSEDTINYYKELGIELKDLQFGYATAYTIAQVIIDLLNIIDKGGMYKFYCFEQSKHCESIGYTCFYR